MAARDLVDTCTLEVTAKDIPALAAVAGRIRPGTAISIPYLPREDDDARLAAARAVRELGFTPMPHLSARRIGSLAALDRFLQRAVADAGVERCFVIAGDPPVPAGPFADSAALIGTGLLERAGIRMVGVGGHPEGHPAMTVAQGWQVLGDKCRDIQQRGMAPLIITQFAFDAGVVLAWLDTLRAQGIGHPVRIGVPGPASIPLLARYAAMCGVSASASVLSRYGISIGRLLGTAGPDVFVDRLAAGLAGTSAPVGLHLFPFGGIARSLDWMERYRLRDGQ
ncbi:methylenetetrahydrofolate reductase [Stenotrophomonas sp. 24(2023)]|uniref:methylenetetrahydrofolate reductase n=1 Tax=Stenotrophomonas sp. 24(2023) TaxID=3068324 RepID=UPI0027DF117F|nr:methylenetetrahydrofolate reductase [Stenotrophomonas sp. 24(2023)]WMJ69221.1 methylenetetrahydrofolate reductase [Stenotrophomonas sp. 24(2023)]